MGENLFAVEDTLTKVLWVIGVSPYNGMTKIYDIWIRAVVRSEKAEEIPGLNPEVYPNIQFTRTVGNNPKDFSDEKWKKIIERLFEKQGVRVPDDFSLKRHQEVSVVVKQLEEEQFRGEVKIPKEYVGENPQYSIESIY
jgi:hypothetical protein